MRALLIAGTAALSFCLVVPASAASYMKTSNGGCGKAPRTLQCQLRSFDPKPDTKTPIPYVLGSGKKDA